jgi:hypothetical protein
MKAFNSNIPEKVNGCQFAQNVGVSQAQSVDVGVVLSLPVVIKIEPGFDQFHFVIDRCERLVFALVTAGASLSFEHKSEGEEHTEDLFRA